ncbi:MAG TPA: hypothetical protein VI455_16875 [Terriglobia bacterium]
MSICKLRTSLLVFSLVLLAATSSFAQYGGGTMGSGGTTGGYTPPKGGYSSSTGIAIGAGVAAGAGIAYLALRNHGTVVGCVQPSSDGMKLMNEKDRNIYALVAENIPLNPGERVALRGKKSKDDSDKPTFHVSKLVKDYGSCKP